MANLMVVKAVRYLPRLVRLTAKAPRTDIIGRVTQMRCIGAPWPAAEREFLESLLPVEGYGVPDDVYLPPAGGSYVTDQDVVLP